MRETTMLNFLPFVQRIVQAAIFIYLRA